jgi:hypothetical protein
LDALGVCRGVHGALWLVVVAAPCATPLLEFCALGRCPGSAGGQRRALLARLKACKSVVCTARARCANAALCARLRMRPLQAFCRRGRLATIDRRRDVWTSQGRAKGIQGAPRGVGECQRGAEGRPQHTIIAVYITHLAVASARGTGVSIPAPLQPSSEDLPDAGRGLAHRCLVDTLSWRHIDKLTSNAAMLLAAHRRTSRARIALRGWRKQCLRDHDGRRQ